MSTLSNLRALPAQPHSETHDDSLMVIDWEKRRIGVARAHAQRVLKELDYQESWLDRRRGEIVAKTGGEQLVLAGAGAYHKPGCGWIPKGATEMTRGQAIAKGHGPCSSYHCFHGEPT